VAGNAAANGRPDLAAAAGATVTADHSALGSGSGFTLSAASFANLPFAADLRLQPLADNGGPTPTHLPGTGSAAIDHGSNPGGLTADQRGVFPRVNGPAADIGAVEADSPNLPVAALGPVGDVTANG